MPIDQPSELPFSHHKDQGRKPDERSRPVRRQGRRRHRRDSRAGEAIARLFAERGAKGIVICGRNVKNGKRVARELAKGGCRVEYVEADLADLAETRAVMAAADKAFGRVDTLVNAAGITDRGTVFDTSPALFERMMAVNLRAPFFLLQDAATIMRREKIEGTVVNIQSMSAHGGQPFLTPYCVSKGALATLTKNAAFALMPWRIRVNGFNLGWMNTPGEDRIVKALSRRQGRLAREGDGRAAVRPADRDR